MDVLAAIVEKLQGVNDWPVYAELPHDFELAGLPAVDVWQVGPAERRAAMNALGADIVEFDVDIYTTPAMWNSGDAWKLANAARMELWRWWGASIHVVDASRPESRPDRNENIRRVGFTVSVMVAA